MNAFRLVFLASVLGASVLFAFARLTPGVWEDQLVRSLEVRAEAEVRAVLAAERHAMAEREVVAAHIAADRMIAASLDTSATNPPAVAPTFARVRDAHLRDDDSWAVLFDARGEPAAPAAFRGTISPRDFGEIADVPRALESGEVQTRYSVVAGRFFAAVAVPVRGEGSRPIGAVVVAHEFSGRTAAERRAVGALDLAFFANREVVAATTSDASITEELASLIRRTDNDSVGTRHGIRGHSMLRYTARYAALGESSEVEAQARIALLVPVRFDGANDPLAGAVIIVDAPSPPTTLAGILIEGRAFDDSTITVWVFIMGGLLVFFVGLLVHDFAWSRSIRTLADRIADRITMNEPTALGDDVAMRSLRPIADAFNRFLEAYRQTAHLARNAQAEASVASQEVGALQHQLQELKEGSGEIRIPKATSRVNRPTGKTPAVRPRPTPAPAPAPAPTADDPDDLLDPDAFDDADPTSTGTTVPPGPDAPTGGATHPMPPEAHPIRRTPATSGDVDTVSAGIADANDPPRASHDDAGPDSDAPLEDDDLPTFALDDDDASAATAEAGTETGDEAGPEQDAEPNFALAEAPAPPAPPTAPGLELADDPDADPFDVLDALAGGPAPAPADAPEAADTPAPSQPPAPTAPADAPEAADAPAPPQPPAPPAVPTTDDTDASAHDDLFEPDGNALDAAFEQGFDDATGGLDYNDGASFDDVLPPLDEPAPATPNRPEDDTVIPGTESPASWSSNAGDQLASMLAEDVPPAPEPVEDDAPVEPPPMPQPVQDEPPPTPEPVRDDVPPVPRPVTDAVPSVPADDAPSDSATTTERSSEDLLAAAEERLKRIRMSRKAAPFIGDDADAGLDDAEDPEMRALYDQFVEGKRSVGEDVSRFTYEGFATRIEKNRAKLRKQYNCSDVTFRVEVKDGKATLKATPVR